MGDKVNKQRAIDFVNAKWTGDKRCPTCLQVAWAMSEIIVELSEFNQGALVVGGPKVPVIPVTCSNCGYTQFYNAILIGEISAAKDPDEKTHPAPTS